MRKNSTKKKGGKGCVKENMYFHVIISCFFYLAFPQMSMPVLKVSLTPDPPYIRGHVFICNIRPNLETSSFIKCEVCFLSDHWRKQDWT